MSNGKKENLKLFIKKLKTMRGYFGLGQLSATEKSDILNQHKSLYNGYRTMQPEVSNTQPLYVYDFAGDKDGMVVNNKGEVKKYTNMGINEQVEENEMCNECGGMMYEGECSECGYKGEMGEETGHLDDIYNVNDLGDNDFDYVEGGGNDYGTFEGMHKNLYKEGSYVIGSDGKPRDMKPGEKFSVFSPEDFEDDYDFEDEDDFEDPDNEDDGFEDIQAGEEMEEQGYTGGGNAPDMDISNIKPAYDFISNGPDEVYPTEEMDEQCLDCVEEYETMESAWSEEEIDEVDVSGSQGIYGDMEKAYDFDSEGPGKAGPYQRSSYNEGETDEQYLPKHAWKHMARQQAAKDKGEDFDPNEFDPSDYEGLDSLSSWEDIKSYFGDSDWSEVDEDLQESFISQKNKVMEMMNRMKIIK